MVASEAYAPVLQHILFLSERMRASERFLNLPRALAIGLAQAMAIIPGISRSGSTIGMAIALGVSREEAARFSFLMALPVILGATALEVLDLIQEPAAAGGPCALQRDHFALGELRFRDRVLHRAPRIRMIGP
mgnify:CR=1 FL=1